ncbi:YceI family protein [Flagellimonas onchidii]|uniref:YceI family protein n=1 Tax=Flagellimonas onchidii TaxID=2562684 RepID=UPI0010A68FAB|nr:YceI family protein [Allomuricauda onchidii]
MLKSLISGIAGCLLICSSTLQLQAQEKFIDKNGIIIFEASEEVFEEVKAINKSVTTIYDSQSNKIASLALVIGFQFKNSLMQEHFNENYVESETYPKAIFRGQLQDFDLKELGPDVMDVNLKGILNFHGKDKEITTTVQMQRIGDVLQMIGGFIVTPLDFDIKIPKIVRNKIAKEVQVKIDFKLSKK